MILFFMCSFLLTGCNKTELHYVETNEPAVTEAPEPFTYTHAEDSQNNVWQNTWKTQYDMLYCGKYLFCSFMNRIYRINTETGNITTACADPLCFHGPECPFYNNNTPPTLQSVYNNKIYFKTRQNHYNVDGTRQTDSEGKPLSTIQSKVYHVEEQKVTISERTYSNASGWTAVEYCTEDAEYYYDTIWDEETEYFNHVLMRYDTKSKTNRVIRDISKETFMVFFKHEDDRLYYCDELSIGWLDIQTGEKHPIYVGDCASASCDEMYFYYTKAADRSLWRIPISGGKPQALGVTGAQPDTYITDHYMYFRYDDRPQVILEDGNSYTLSGGQDIWRMKKDGSEKELIYSFKDKHPNMTFVNFVVSGNYLYGYWEKIGENGKQYWSRDPNDDPTGFYGDLPPPGILWGSILRVDMTTGEHYYFNIYS